MQKSFMSGLIVVIAMISGLTISTHAQDASFSDPQSPITSSRASHTTAADSAAILKQWVSLNVRNVTLETALRELSRQVNQRLVYEETVSSIPVRVSLQANRLTLETALRRILDGTGVEIVVTPSGQSVVLRHGQGIQIGTITGRVIDSTSREG